jgi:protein involved in polysaccharide export with SLBB domain
MMIKHLRVTAACTFTTLFLALAACGPQQELASYPDAGIGVPTGTDSIGMGRQVIRTGDLLEIYVLEDENFNGIYRVRDGGHVIFPKVGRVEVAGKTLAGAEAAIKASFEGPAQQLQTASVIVERHEAPAAPDAPQGITVLLSGDVGQTGAVTVPFINDMRPTAYQAIVHAGGFGPWANRKRVSVVRRGNGGQEKFELDMREVGVAGSDMPLREGDMIIVPRRGFGF